MKKHTVHRSTHVKASHRRNVQKQANRKFVDDNARFFNAEVAKLGKPFKKAARKV